LCPSFPRFRNPEPPHALLFFCLPLHTLTSSQVSLCVWSLPLCWRFSTIHVGSLITRLFVCCPPPFHVFFFPHHRNSLFVPPFSFDLLLFHRSIVRTFAFIFCNSAFSEAFSPIGNCPSRVFLSPVIPALILMFSG